MVTPNRRRQAVKVLEYVFGVSERRACKVVGQNRSTQRHQPVEPSELEVRVRELLREFSRAKPRHGWRRANKWLRREHGIHVNAKRVQRLWRDEGLKVPYRRRKKRLSGIGADVGAICPIAPNAIWAMDFQFDATTDGKALKLLNIVDEFTRECPAIVVSRSIDADKVVATLDAIAVVRGYPAFVRFDNGPEFVAHAIVDWCRFNAVQSVFIDPGCPWQNAWIESFNGRLRDELLNSHQFDSLLEARVLIEDHRTDYNTNRPHTAHGDLTPNEFALQWTNQHQPVLA